MSDQYLTVARAARVKTAVGACRFIASVCRTCDEEEARVFIAGVSAELSSATHHAFAYKTGYGRGAVSRNSDAGEPAGSAGQPILQAIEKAGLTNVTVVGTRYFGGVKLGIGGLVRAYRSCAEAGLQEAGVESVTWYVDFTVTVPYGQLGTVLREVAKAGGLADSVRHQEDGATVLVRVPAGASVHFSGQLPHLTGGKAKILIGNNILKG